MKFPAELAPSISIISATVSLGSSDPVTGDPSTKSEFPLFSLPINGSEAKAGGGLRDSVIETGWFPKTFFSIPDCTKTDKNQ